MILKIGMKRMIGMIWTIRKIRKVLVPDVIVRGEKL